MHMLDKTCTAYFFDFRADANIFVICSNGVEQSRFWCRAVFLSRWISSSWPFSESFSKKNLASMFQTMNELFLMKKRLGETFRFKKQTKIIILCLILLNKLTFVLVKALKIYFYSSMLMLHKKTIWVYPSKLKANKHFCLILKEIFFFAL